MPAAAAAADDGFQLARGRKPRKFVPLVLCLSPQRMGTRPRNVVEEGLRGKGYRPARCFECDRPYQLGPGAAPAATWQRPPAVMADSHMQKLQAELKDYGRQRTTRRASQRDLRNSKKPPKHLPGNLQLQKTFPDISVCMSLFSVCF